MLEVGTPAPDFVASGTNGQSIQLSQLLGKKVVLYFFPKAFTTGCTLETRQFQKAYPAFQQKGIEVIGVSVDSAEKQCAFASQENVSFPMISDENREIGKKYDALWPLLGFHQRITYIIDEKGKIAAAFHHEWDAQKHFHQVQSHLENTTPSHS